ncbi:MAG: nitroreductase family protein [Anaerolineales bacterium]|jgi:coenzyme F420-0:L-glutamate ligase/coenzyme F420-1:gamma-L-glutamate ligase
MSESSRLHTFLCSRRSVRQFKSAAVAQDVVRRILLTATCAPSAHNRQPWRFAVVTDANRRSVLADTMAERFREDLERDGTPSDQVEAQVQRSRGRIGAAPVVIVLCTDLSEMDQYSDASRAESERTMAVQSTANAGVLLLLAAHAEGLGGVWNCAPLFAPAAVRQALELPEDWEPQALLMIGKPAEVPRVRSRKPLQEVAVFL